MLISSLILLQLIIFVGLIYMMQRILSKNIVSATKHIDEMSKDYTKKESEVTRQLEEAKQKAQEILAQAKAEADKARAQTIKDTQAESDKIVKQARTQGDEMIQQADKTRQLLLSEMNERIDAASIGKACELIQHVLPEKFKKDIHSQWIGELLEEGFSHIERLRIPKDIQEIKVASAFKLDEETRQALAKKMKSILGRDVTLKEEPEPKIVAGITITIGSLVLDGSLKNKIQEYVKSAKHATS